MQKLRKFTRKDGKIVTAVQLDLDTKGFEYRKWGGLQTAKRLDWVVDNGGDVYTVDGDTFERTYRRIGAGTYRKEASVWARSADQDGEMKTKEGFTKFRAGDMLVFNDREGRDGYAMSAARFNELYQPAQT